MKLHHIGYIVKSIEDYEKHLFYEEKIVEVFDPVQNANLALYSNFGSSFLELIQPIDNQSFTHGFLEKNGNAYHHVCYEVASVEEMKMHCEAKKYLLFKGPLQAILFEGKEVYFYYTKNKTIIEFLING
jgi:hypothetical protein